MVMPTDEMILDLSVLREFQRRREATLVLYFIYHREKAYKKQLWLALGSSQKAIDGGMDFLMKMHLITTKPADDPFVDLYFVLTPSGKVIGKVLDEYVSTIVDIWKSNPNHRKEMAPLR